MISIENILNQMITKLEQIDLDIVELALQDAIEKLE